MSTPFYDPEGQDALQFVMNLLFGGAGGPGGQVPETTKLRPPGSSGPIPLPGNVRVPPSQGTFQLPEIGMPGLFGPGGGKRWDPATRTYVEGGPDFGDVSGGSSVGIPQVEALAEALAPAPAGGGGGAPGGGAAPSAGRAGPTPMIAFETPALAKTIAHLQQRPTYFDPGIPEEAFGNMRAIAEAYRPSDPGKLGFWDRLKAAGVGIGSADMQGLDPSWAGFVGVMDAQSRRDQAYTKAIGTYLDKKLDTEKEIAKITGEYNREVLETEQKVMDLDAQNYRELATILKPTSTIAENYIITSYVDPESGRVTFHRSGPISATLEEFRRSQTAKNWMDVASGGEGKKGKDKLPPAVQRAADFQQALALADDSPPGTMRAMLAGKAMLLVQLDPFHEDVIAARKLTLDESGPMAQLFGNEAQFHSALAGAGAKDARVAADDATAMALILLWQKEIEAGGDPFAREAKRGAGK